jgi:Holliday junction resolvase RusA-like endonuclease
MQVIHARGRMLLIPAKGYSRWLRAARPQVKAQTRGALLPFTTPVSVKAVAYRWTRRKIDLANILSAVDDMLEACGVLADDALVESHDGSRKILGVPKDEARVEIEIDELNGGGPSCS